MTRTKKWLLGLGITAAAVAALVFAALALVPGDDELAEKAEQKLEQALGVKVSIGSLGWMVFPQPAVVLQEVATRQDMPLKARRIVAYVHWRPLLDKVVSIQSVEVDGAEVPQLSLRAFSGAGKDKDVQQAPAGKDPSAGKPWRMADVPLEHFHFTDLTWITRRGVPAVYEGDIDFDANWRPRQALVRRPGITPPAQLTLTRHGQEDRWDTRAAVGGGTAHGEIRLKTLSTGKLRLDGELLSRDIEVASAVRSFNRKAIVSGRGAGSTVLESEGGNVAELARALHTRTQFTVAPASVLRFDLHKAIKTLGKEHDGQTPLESISGVMDSQNTGQGTVWSFTGLKATSGALKASGNIVIFAGRIEANGAVDLVDGLVGVPIHVTGELKKPEVSVPKGAIAGAAIGTAILPGIGTIIGARLGGLFNRGPADAPEADAPTASGTKPPPSGPRAR